MRAHTYESTEASTHMSRRSRNAHGQVTRAILCGNLQEKCRIPSPKEPFCGNLEEKSRTQILLSTFCARLRSRNARGHVRRASLCGNLQENAAHSVGARHFVRACAVETRMDIAQGPFFAVIYKKKCRTLFRPPRLKHRAFYCDRKNPFSAATLFGELLYFA